MTQVNSNIDPDDEQLLAYLDGDLPDDVMKAIDARVATDVSIQRRIDELRASWDLLDELPESVSNPKLAESTIELVALRMMEERKKSFLSSLFRMRWPLIVVGTLLALLGGVWASIRQYHRDVDHLVGTLPLLARYSEVDLIDRPEWLEKLSEIDSLVEAGLPLYEANRPAELPSVPTQRAELPGWLDNLETEPKRRLYEHFGAYQAASPERQANLQKISDMIHINQPKDYSTLLKAYAGLVGNVGSAEMTQIAAIQNPDERAAWVQKVVYRELVIGYSNSLSEPEQASIRDWVGEIKEENFEYFFAVEDPDSEIILMLESASDVSADGSSGVQPPHSVIAPSDVIELIGRLSDTGRKLLGNLSESQRLTALSLWVHASLPTTRPRPRLSSEELQRAFKAQPLERQNELIYQPGSEVIKALTEAAAATGEIQ